MSGPSATSALTSILTRFPGSKASATTAVDTTRPYFVLPLIGQHSTQKNPRSSDEVETALSGVENIEKLEETHAQAVNINRLRQELARMRSNPKDFDLAKYKKLSKEMLRAYRDFVGPRGAMGSSPPVNGKTHEAELQKLHQALAWQVLILIISLLLFTKSIPSLLGLLARLETNPNAKETNQSSTQPPSNQTSCADVLRMDALAAILGEEELQNCGAVMEELGYVVPESTKLTRANSEQQELSLAEEIRLTLLVLARNNGAYIHQRFASALADLRTKAKQAREATASFFGAGRTTNQDTSSNRTDQSSENSSTQFGSGTEQTTSSVRTELEDDDQRSESRSTPFSAKKRSTTSTESKEKKLMANQQPQAPQASTSGSGIGLDENARAMKEKLEKSMAPIEAALGSIEVNFQWIKSNLTPVEALPASDQLVHIQDLQEKFEEIQGDFEKNQKDFKEIQNKFELPQEKFAKFEEIEKEIALFEKRLATEVERALNAQDNQRESHRTSENTALPPVVAQGESGKQTKRGNTRDFFSSPTKSFYSSDDLEMSRRRGSNDSGVSFLPHERTHSAPYDVRDNGDSVPINRETVKSLFNTASTLEQKNNELKKKISQFKKDVPDLAKLQAEHQLGTTRSPAREKLLQSTRVARQKLNERQKKSNTRSTGLTPTLA